MRIFSTILLLAVVSSCSSNSTIKNKVYQRNEVDIPSKLIVRIEPVYPIQVINKKMIGRVKVSAIITEEGKVTNINVLDAYPKGIFEKEAQKVFNKWIYRPAVVNDKAVQMYLEEIVEFTYNK